MRARPASSPPAPRAPPRPACAGRPEWGPASGGQLRPSTLPGCPGSADPTAALPQPRARAEQPTSPGVVHLEHKVGQQAQRVCREAGGSWEQGMSGWCTPVSARCMRDSAVCTVVGAVPCMACTPLPAQTLPRGRTAAAAVARQGLTGKRDAVNHRMRDGAGHQGGHKARCEVLEHVAVDGAAKQGVAADRHGCIAAGWGVGVGGGGHVTRSGACRH